MDAENQNPPTLVERRKRLHELASEINQWEDESFKCSHPTPSTPTLSMSYEALNKSTASNYCSPKQPHCHTSITRSSPSRQLSPFNYNPLGVNTNYLNRNIATSASHLPPAVTSPSTAGKRKLDSGSVEKCVTFQHVECSPSKIAAVNSGRASFSTIREDLPKLKASALVSSIKAQLEGNSAKSNQDADMSVQLMTPKSIIQKFEALSKAEQQQQAASVLELTAPVRPPASSIQASVQVKRRSTSDQTTEEREDMVVHQSVIINTESIKPKSVIQKFEQLVKTNGNATPMPAPLVPTSSITSTVQAFELKIRKSNESQSTNRESNQSQAYGATASLTYVSSVVSSTASARSSRDLNDYEPNDEENIYYEEEREDGEETVEIEDEDRRERQNGEEEAIYEEMGTPRVSQEDETSLFEDEQTGYESMSDEDCYTTDQIQTDAESNYSESCAESVYPAASTIGSSSANSNEAPRSKPPTGSSLIPDDALVSIKEYRKQKKGYYSNSGRRSSVSKMHGGSNPATTSKTKIPAKLMSTTEAADEQRKKNQEKIKELEELIKQEDSIIQQTGAALEKCMNQSQFTGTSEHIEANRLLLIACQKRQAYQTEINRLKTAISEANQKKAMTKPSDATSTADSGADGDLTGTLVLGDIQLPIKESYLKKLRSGEEKRIFYFICLVRNGIQVLQTQVISVQELLNSSHDSSITFPNRMAIKNVDVNFKVKIDVYTLEMLPREGKGHKHASNATQKFFSPFKNTVINTLLHTGHHQSSLGSSSSTNRGVSNGNHHYNDSSSLGVAYGGSKTTNFIHVDTVEMTNKDLNQNKFKLSISSSSIPLSGLLIVNVRCTPSKSIELKGFLTIFEDINGLGSWDRRWCLLNNYSISYWKYPEDEAQSTPLGLINLSECQNDKVSILPREICARKYTIELTMHEDEQASAICKRFRLSADTKEQANEWSIHINWALANLRLWNPKKRV